MQSMSVNPFVVGQWVRGDRFYGREPLILELLESPKNVLWVLGTRRVGKTSLLKEIELRTSKGEQYFPVFWDFQGASAPEELHEVFGEALLDAEERLEEIGIDPEAIAGNDLFESIRKLRRALSDLNLDLLLLCDEVEELLGLSRNAPAFVARLRRTLHQGLGLRTVLASTIRLWGLTQQSGDTSPFLHGCEPPLYLSRLRRSEAWSLVAQEKRGPENRPEISDEDIERICDLCGNHPYLVQLLSKRFLEAGDLNQALVEVDLDPMVGFFFTVDYEMLDPVAQEVLSSFVENPASDIAGLAARIGVSSPALQSFVGQLAGLGFLDLQGRRLELSSFFFRRWLERRLEGEEHRPAYALTSAARAVAAVALDRLAMGVVLVDKSQKVVFCNRSGRELIDSDRGLIEGPLGISASDSAEARALRMLINNAAGASSSAGGIQLSNRHGDGQLSLVVVPLSSPVVPGEDGAIAAIFVSDPSRGVDSSDDVLRSVYSLTRAESRLAHELLAGRSLEDSASHLGVSINTARTHMRRILAKTNTHRQGEFIRLVLSGPLAWVDPRS